MRISWIFKGSWTLQLLIGVGLSLCSFFIAYTVLQAVLTPPVIALVVAVLIECGKVTAIVRHACVSHLSFLSPSLSMRFISLFFRLGLVAISLLCSQLFFNDCFSFRQLEQGRVAPTAAVSQPQKGLDRLTTWYHARKKAGNSQDKDTGSHRKRARNQQTITLGSLFLVESAAGRKKSHTPARHRSDRRQTQRSPAAATTAAGVVDDSKQRTLSVATLQKLAATLLEQSSEPSQFVFFLALLLSLLLEMGIILLFTTVTASIAPIVTAQYEAALEEEVLLIRVDGKTKREKMTHAAAMEKIRTAGRRTVEEAKAALPSP